MSATKRLSAQARKIQILEAATHLFSEKGFHGVSIDEIVGRAGISPALLYQHFRSKESLYEAVQQDAACRREDYLEALLEADGDLEAVLRNMTRVFATSVSRNPGILKMELHSLLEGSDANRDFFENRWKSFIDLIAYMIEENTANDGLEDVDPRNAGLMFQGMIREAMIAKCLTDDDRFLNISLDHLLSKQVTLFMKILESNSPPGGKPV